MKRLDIIKSYYEPNLKKELPDYKILGWESEEAQNMRFDILISHLKIDGKKILDVGCGLGNLLEYINSKNIEVSYTGVDILEGMIESAKRKNLKGSFYCVDIFSDSPFEKESFDIVYASGIFNLNLGNNEEFFREALAHFFDLSGRFIVFNLLHYKSPDRDDTYYYFNPDEVVEIIRGMACSFKKVQIVENYLQNDFTVICEKE